MKHHIYTFTDTRKKTLAIKECIKETLLYEPIIIFSKQILIYEYDFYTLTNSVNIDTEFGKILKESNYPNEVLNVLIDSNKINTNHIY